MITSITQFFKESINRLKLSSPSYFKKMTIFCGALAAFGLYLKGNSIDFELFKSGDSVISLDSILIGAGGFGSFISSLTVDHKEVDKITTNEQK